MTSPGPQCLVTRLVSRDDCRSSERGSIPLRGAGDASAPQGAQIDPLSRKGEAGSSPAVAANHAAACSARHRLLTRRMCIAGPGATSASTCSNTSLE